MLRGCLLPMAIAMSLATPAFAVGAAGSSSTSGNQGPPSSDQGTSQPAPKIASKLQNSLAQAGFTDIHVMPRSFLVKAKDQDGNPVMMVINPNSMTEVTALGGSGNNATRSQSGGNKTTSGSASGTATGQTM